MLIVCGYMVVMVTAQHLDEFKQGMPFLFREMWFIDCACVLRAIAKSSSMFPNVL